ncbi:MAG TPA: ABC transporter ATP-binding protein [Acidimicrobiales bacterium]|nr:ABC transporter ATP-binding protein [Acidimicrobiales bacterium]
MTVTEPARDVEHVLELRKVSAGYAEIEVLHGVSLAVPPRTVFGVLGPNGAGKTTMLHVAAGLHQPTEGDVIVAGRRINGAPPEELARRGLCSIPEGRGIFPNLTVRENLWMATYRGMKRSEIEEATFERFPRLGERRNQHAGTLSGGEQQMLSIARAITTKPALLLLDELSMGLAPLIVEQLYEAVRRIAREGVSVLVVEQFAKTVLAVADVAAIIVGGRVTLAGTPAEVESGLSEAYLGAAAPAAGA